MDRHVNEIAERHTTTEQPRIDSLTLLGSLSKANVRSPKMTVILSALFGDDRKVKQTERQMTGKQSKNHPFRPKSKENRRVKQTGVKTSERLLYDHTTLSERFQSAIKFATKCAQ
jgi:hypothetical protein